MDAGDWGTWAGSIFTGLTLAAALLQIGNERIQRRKVERERELVSRREQATKVSAWIIKPYDFPIWTIISNSSHEPVFNVIVSLVAIQGAGPPRDAAEAPFDYQYRNAISVVPPGTCQLSIESGGHGMNLHLGLEIAFTDSASHHWVRKGNGELAEIAKNPVDYYHMIRPLSWSYPEIDPGEDIP